MRFGRAILFVLAVVTITCRGEVATTLKIPVNLPALQLPPLNSITPHATLSRPVPQLGAGLDKVINALNRFGGRFDITYPWEHPSPKPVEGLIDLFGTVDDLLTASFAERIELMSLMRRTDNYPERHPVYVRGLDVNMLDIMTYMRRTDNYTEGGAIVVEGSDANVLRTLLTLDESYYWRRENVESAFPDYRDLDYHFRIKFYQQERVVIMDLCLDRKIARVVKNGNEVARSSIEFGYNGIAAVIERSFPGETPYR